MAALFLQKALVTSTNYCPFACKCQASYSQLDLQMLMAVHLIGYGSVPNLRSVLYLSLNLEKHLAGKLLQQMLM